MSLGQLLSLSIFHLVLTVCPSVFLHFSFLCTCFPFSKGLEENMKQVEAEMMKVRIEAGQAGSDNTLENA